MLNDVRLERIDDREQLLLLLGGYLERVQGIHEVVLNDVELCFRDAQPCVNGFGISADDLARPTRDVADQIDVLLDQRLPDVRTHPLGKGPDPRIGEFLSLCSSRMKVVSRFTSENTGSVCWSHGGSKTRELPQGCQQAHP